MNPRPRYGKGKYKYTTVRPTKRGKRKRSYFGGWKPEHKRLPLLEWDYIGYFDFNCSQYSHYLDAVMNKIEYFEDNTDHGCGLYSLEDDVFVHVGMYVGTYDIPIIFNSGCSIVVTPYK